MKELSNAEVFGVNGRIALINLWSSIVVALMIRAMGDPAQLGIAVFGCKML